MQPTLPFPIRFPREIHPTVQMCPLFEFSLGTHTGAPYLLPEMKLLWLLWCFTSIYDMFRLSLVYCKAENICCFISLHLLLSNLFHTCNMNVRICSVISLLGYTENMTRLKIIPKSVFQHDPYAIPTEIQSAMSQVGTH